MFRRHLIGVYVMVTWTVVYGNTGGIAAYNGQLCYFRTLGYDILPNVIVSHFHKITKMYWHYVTIM